MSLLKFDRDTISDQKRLVRGEQYLAARTALRARDHVHNTKWRVLIMAGGSPGGEVRAIKELMPKAHITAVDNDQRCLEAAINAGVDEVVQCDLANFSGKCGTSSYGPALELRGVEQFDVMCLDLCGGVNPKTNQIVKAYSWLVRTDGLFIFTFSYGRDVIEAIRKQPLHAFKGANLLIADGASEMVLRRIAYVFDRSRFAGRISSIFVYRGNEMPMCSVMCGGEQILASEETNQWGGVVGRKFKPSYVQVEPGDFELAACYPDSAALYDCPQDRIDALRRRFAALKASMTRRGAGALPLETA